MLETRQLHPTLAREVVGLRLWERLDDAAFWHLITDFSEPGGYFRSDNFLSNERAYQRVIPTLTSTLPPGGVYMGVGLRPAGPLDAGRQDYFAMQRLPLLPDST